MRTCFGIAGCRHTAPQIGQPCGFGRRCVIRTSACRAQAQQAELHATEKGRQLKENLRKAIDPVKSCGIFGVKAAELEAIHQAVESLESENPLSEPTARLELLAGEWNVIFSTIKVTGSRRVKLGLKDLVQIGQLTQEIDAASSIALGLTRESEPLRKRSRPGTKNGENTELPLQTNRVGFNVPAFGVKNGELVLKAAYQISSPSRVTITLEEATLVPERLQRVFEANFGLLLSIFNPEGFLDITYCDAEVRCGRDDKGNIFVLERPQ